MLNDASQTANAVNTFDYTTNHRTHFGELSYAESIRKTQVTFSLGLSTTAVDRMERLPGQPKSDNRFNALRPGLSIVRMGNIVSNFSLAYRTMPLVPSVEQLRPRLDNRNLYNLRAGNADLKQGYRHALSVHYNHMIGKSGSALSMQLQASYTGNYVAPIVHYFAQQTSLPQYDDYVAPAGSSLTTFRNVDGLWQGEFETTYRMSVRKIRCTLLLGPRFAYTDQPSFQGERLIRTRTWSPALRVELTSNFSRKIRIGLNSVTGYSYSDNSAGNSDKYLRESLGANITVDNIFKRFVLNAKYNGIFYRRISDSYRDDSHVLNLSFGCKILKRMGEVNLAVFDVLNSTSGFSTRMNADYVEKAWTQSFGRYFTLNLALKFNKTRSGVAYQGSMNDGSVKQSGR